MKLQLFVLVCCLASLANCLFISGIPNTICGEEGLNVTFESFSSPTNVSVVASVPTVGISPSFISLFPPEATEVITITCNTIGAVKISFVNPTTQATYASFSTYCKGVVYIQNPISSIIRGNDFSQTLFLFPTPQSVVDIVVKVDNPIVVPGSDRLTFGVGQNTEEELFYVPAGDVGHVNIAFDSRSLRDYSGPNCQELVLSFDVLGTITSDLAAKTLGDGVYTDVTVQIHPPARDTVIVNIDASTIGVAEPSFLVYHTGQDIATFRLLPKFENVTFPTTVTFTADYYDTLVEFIYVIGTIFTSIPPIVPTTGVEDLHVAILPGAGEAEVIVYLTASSNVIVPPFLVFPPGVSLLHFSLQAITEGPGYVTFTSEGYVAFTDSFLVQDLDCSATQTYNINSTQCVSCPVLNGNVCSGNGVCSFSTIDQYKARCACNAGFAGGYCELAAPSDFATQFTSDGITFDYEGIPGVTDTLITVHPETIIDNNPIDGGNGTVYIRGYDAASPFPLAVSPSATAPSKSNFRTVTLEPGFGIDVTYSDNTIFDILNNPLTFTFYFDDAVISQTDFLEMSLYYYNATLQSWVPAINTCPASEQLFVPSLTELTIETNLCVLGQYQFFAFVPIPQNPVVAPVYTYNNYQFGHQEDYQFATTGQTGVQQQAPPQPNIPVIANDPSPPRNIAEEDNASSFVAPSYYLLPILLVLSLLF